jgi:hypothetical protein
MSNPDSWLQESVSEPPALPPEIDTTKPSVARGYDFALGGKNNFEVDRAAMRRLDAAFPGILPLAKDNRGFLRRGVQCLVREAGIRQFVDVGSGLPSAGNVHEVASRSGCRPAATCSRAASSTTTSRAKELEQLLVTNFRSGWFRTWDEQTPYFDGLELVEPGFVYANDWHPDGHTPTDSPWHTFYCGGIGRKA